MAITVRTPVLVVEAVPTATAASLAVPSGMVENDLDFVWGCYAVADGGYTTPTDYTQQYKTNTAGELESAIYDRLAAATPGVTSLAHNASRRLLAGRLGLNGVDLTTPIHVQSASVETGFFTEDPGGTPTATSITTTVAGCLVIARLHLADGGTSATTWPGFPAGWTTIANRDTGSGSQNVAEKVGYKILETPGPSGDFAVTYYRETGARVCNWHATQIAYQPVQVGGGGSTGNRLIMW